MLNALDNLENCKRAYTDRGVQLITITHLDGRKSGISNPAALKVVMDALLRELDSQIAEVKKGTKNEKVESK